MKTRPELLALAAIALLSIAAIAGSSRLSGPVLVTSGTHGLHLGDLAVLAIAVAGAAGVLLLRRP